jgi:peptidoglycan/LPS O-acetylase OafA/YrhL
VLFADRGLNTWFWIIAVLGIARRTLSFTNEFLRYFNRISYPFYIVHLVVISVAGHYITRMRLGIVVEFVMLCVVSFVVSTLCCEAATLFNSTSASKELHNFQVIARTV